MDVKYLIRFDNAMSMEQDKKLEFLTRFKSMSIELPTNFLMNGLEIRKLLKKFKFRISRYYIYLFPHSNFFRERKK